MALLMISPTGCCQVSFFPPVGLRRGGEVLLPSNKLNRNYYPYDNGGGPRYHVDRVANK